MAGDIFNVEPPRWLQAIAQPIDTKLAGRGIATLIGGALGASERQEQQGGAWFQNFLGAAGEARMSMADPLWRLKANEIQLGMMKDVVGIATAETALKTHKLELANVAHDTEVWPKWLAENHDNIIRAPSPDLRTPQFNNLYQMALGRQTAIENGRVVSIAMQDLVKGRDQLPPSWRIKVPIPEAGDPNFTQNLNKAQADLAKAQVAYETQRKWDSMSSYGRPGSALGVARVTRTSTDPWTKESTTTVLEPPGAGPGQGQAISSFDRRVDALLKANAAEAGPFGASRGQVPTEAMKQALTDAEVRVFGGSQEAMAEAALTPGASRTVTPEGLKSVTIQRPEQGGPMPEPIPIFDGPDPNVPGAWQIPVPTIRGTNVTGWTYHITRTAQDRAYTANTYFTAAQLLNNQLLTKSLTLTPEQSKAFTEKRDAYVAAGDAIMAGQIRSLTNAPTLGGTNTLQSPIRNPIGARPPTAAGTNYGGALQLSPDGQLVPVKP